MKMDNLFGNLPSLTEEYENFAYFCKYDRETRTVGDEKLYLSGIDPLYIRDGTTAPFRRIEDHFGMPAGNYCRSEYPVIYGYDYVDSILPDIRIRRSEWPRVMAILPEKVITGRYIRTELPLFTPTDNFSDPDQENRIRDAIERIRRGELLQVVLSERFRMNDLDLFRALEKMSRFDRSLYVFFFRFGKYQVIGSSPENLVTVNNRTAEIFPIAGTRPRGENGEEDMKLEDELLNDSKELLEHRMLVDLARNDLGRISRAGTVRVTMSMKVQKFATVQHIVSRVQGTLDDRVDLDDTVNSVFPAGTVTGAPKKRAMQIINQAEKFARGPYAGSIGIAGPGYVDMALSIRSIFTDGNETFTQAGAGIVKDSVPASEVMEIRRKASTVMGGVGLESSADKQL
jgi:anthranilate synthase component 1